MEKMNETTAVQKQYKTANNLNTRISIHHKYSTNKQSYGDWIYENYAFSSGFKVLELGCGTGEMWIQKASELPEGTSLLLTDFSAGMLETTKENLSDHKNIEYAVVDIQRIPYADHSFDAVIANMMLYHVPDLHKGLSEVRRVLKPGGTFYCATYGETSIAQYLCTLLEDFDLVAKLNKNFTLQNGTAALQQHFTSVQRLDRDDALAVTDIEDIVDYLYSLTSMTNLQPESRAAITETLAAKMQNGVLYIPKEYGMFLCK